MEDYSIRLLDPAHFDQLIPLMKDCFGLHVDVEYFRWKFLRNPAGTFIGFVAVAPSGEYAAYYGVIPEVFQFGTQQRTIYQSCDTMTHSRHRRKGLFQSLAIRCYDHLQKENALFVIGFGGGQSTPGFLKFGWMRVFDMHYLFRPSIRSWVAKSFRSTTLLKMFEVKEAMDINLIVSFQKAQGSNRIHQSFSEEFVRWRLGNPRIRYTMKIITRVSDGQRIGYFIYYVEGTKIILFDFFTSGSEARQVMLDYLDELCLDRKCKGIVTIAQLNSSFASELRNAGFWINPFNFGPLHTRIPFIFYTKEPDQKQFLNSNQWEVIPFCHDSL